MMMMMPADLKLLQMLVLPLCLLLLGLVYSVIAKPILLQRRLKSLGIRGPSYRFFYGNTLEIQKLRKDAMAKPMSGVSHDIYSRLQPHLSLWSKTYDLEAVKEVANDREKAYRKVPPRGTMKQLLGDGLVTSDGEKWAKMRKLANIAFFGESLKSMIPAMIASTEMMMERWKSNVGKEMEVFEEFRFLTAEIISRTAFGSSYLEGKQLFYKLSKLTEIAASNAFKIRIPGLSKIYRSRDDIKAKELEQGIRATVLGMLRKREEMVAAGEADDFGNDFLGLLLRANHERDESKRITVDDVVDECKTFYLAGQETTNTLLAWVILLLSVHTDWQEKARAEVLSLFGSTATPDADGIARLKTTMRLYPPAVGIAREVVKEVRVGKLTLLKNINITVDTISLHRDPEIWGEDAHSFNPERFSEGVAKATKNNPIAFQPFGIGVRVCVGSNFSANEAKIALSMILQRYRFTLSPAYVHSPIQVVTTRPQHGVQVILHAIQ
ncbi:Cytochrome P450 CYP749A22 [Linum grandiflorum]